MPLSDHVHETKLRVRYSETDASGLAHHASYMTWLEAGRIDWLRAVGADYARLERDGYHLAVVELRMRYATPARFDDRLVVRTALVRARSRDAVFRQEVVTAEEHPRQRANGTVRVISLRQGRLSPLPELVRAATEA